MVIPKHDSQTQQAEDEANRICVQINQRFQLCSSVQGRMIFSKKMI